MPSPADSAKSRPRIGGEIGGGSVRRLQAGEARPQLGFEPGRDPTADAVAQRRIEEVGGHRLDSRRQRRLAGHETPHRRPAPQDVALGAEGQRGVRPVRERPHALGHVGAERAVRRRAQPARFAQPRVGLEPEAEEPAHAQALHAHLAVLRDFDDGTLRIHPRHHGGPTLDELLGEPLVQGVGQAVLDGTRALLPVPGIGQPVLAVRDVGPGPDVRDAREQRLHVPLGAVDGGDLRRDPVLGQAAGRGDEVPEDLREQARVRFRHDVAEVRDLGHLPQQADPLRSVRLRAHLRDGAEGGQRAMVVGIAHADEGGRGRTALEAGQERGRARRSSRSELRQKTRSRGSK